MVFILIFLFSIDHKLIKFIRIFKNFADGPQPNTLQEVELPIVSNADCNTTYTNLCEVCIIGSSQLCAGFPEGGKDSCQVHF